MRRQYLYIIFALTALMISCDGMDDYSLSPNHHLAFSADTLSFDTVFTSIGSVTGYFMVYNPNDEALKIEHIALASGGKSGFRINMDGRKGDNFAGIPVWKHDSLYVAVEVTVNPNDDYTPFVIHDSIAFVTNGLTQWVILEAYGQNAHIYRGGKTFATDAVLTADRPYLVYDSVVIAEGATVEIAKGTTIYMHKNAKWATYGTLKIQGTQDEPVTIRGDRLYNFSSTVSYDNIAAQWTGMYFGAKSFDNEFNYAMIRNGVNGLDFAESTPERKKIDVRNSQIYNMDGNLLQAVNCYIEASNSEFSNASAAIMVLVGGVYQFSHCTLANFMPSAMISNGSSRSAPSLILSENLVVVYPDETAELFNFPLRQAFFDNCIIDGSISLDAQDWNGELQLYADAEHINGDDEYFNFRFNHCFIKVKKAESERFTDNIYGDSPAYRKSTPAMLDEDGKYDYVFDFRPAKESSVIGKGDPAIAAKFPTDRFGVSRDGGSPTIGAYEYEDEK